LQRRACTKSLRNLVHDVIERLSSQPSPFVALDRLLPHNNLLQVSVRESDVLLHCHLLEHFVSIRSQIDAWAEENTVDEGAAWTCYINAGIRRLTQWFEASLSGHVDLNTHIPPLDVLLVWHAFLQDPVEWKRFADTTKVEFSGWNSDALVSTNDFDVYNPTSDSTVVESPAERRVWGVLSLMGLHE
jgi:hypothetical protein